MRRIKRWLLVVAMIAAAGFMVWLVNLPLGAMRDPVDPDGAGLPAHRGYWLADNRTLKFNLESGRSKVRLLVNAALDGLKAIEDRYGHYSIAYRVLDAEDRELAATEYFMRLRVTQYDGQPKRSFDDRAYLPTDTNLVYLDLASLSNAVRLELTIGQSSATIRGISVRPYYQELRREDRLDRYWQRLHESKRARAAQANSFDTEFLTERERQNLVRRRWRPLVPIGVEDDDYEIVMLRDESVDRLRDETTHAGTSDTTERWFLKAGRAATIGLPRAVRLLVIVQTSGPSNLEPDDLSLSWSGRLRHERAKLTLTSDGTRLQTVVDIDAGVVEFLAHRDMWLQTADLAERRSLAPTINSVRGYAVDRTVLRIPINHAGGSATPIRLDLRTEHAAKFQANVDFVGRDNTVARTRTLTATTTSSDRDWLRYGGSKVPVAAPSTSYLNVGPDIAELHITSNQRIWVSAYNRPPSLTRYRQIPEALFGGTEDTHRYPSWFVLAPTGATQLIDEGLSRVVESTLRTAAITAPREVPTRTERLFPEGYWQGETVLTRNDPRREIPRSALPSTYQSLRDGRQTLSFAALPGEASVVPSMFIQNISADGVVRMDCAGRMLVNLKNGASGRLALPRVPVGETDCAVQASGNVALYISHLTPTGTTYREQNVQLLPADGLRYRYERHTAGRESLALRVYSATPGRIRLRLSLSPWQRQAVTLDDWTFQTTEYDLALEAKSTTFTLADESRELKYEALVFHRIGTDVPPGSIEVLLDLSEFQDSIEPNEIYLGLTRSTVGTADDQGIRIHRFEVGTR